MAKRSPLETLIELAQRETDDAAKKLGESIHAAAETEKKLALLLDYCEDYVARFQSTQHAGITPMQFRNFRAFLDKLDNAVTGQREIVANAHRRTDAMRAVWQESERKRMSYETLASRASGEAQRREAKRDQKQTDEHATRQAFYKQH